MNVYPALACLLACATLTACNNTPQNQQRIREDTAHATAAIKSDVQGAADGIREGLHQPTAATSANDVVDVNTAGKDRLETLPGVDGPVADRIIAHRPYAHASDLTRKHVLSTAEYDRIASRVSAD